MASETRVHPLERLAGKLQPRDRKLGDLLFRVLCIVVATMSICFLVILLASIFYQGFSSLNWNFLVHYPEPHPGDAGIGPALWGTVWVCVVCAIFALPIGVATAIFLEEFRPVNLWLQKLHTFVQLNITNLAGVPSVVYGILGLTLFVGMGGYFGSAKDPSVSIGVKYYDQFLSAGDRVLLVPVPDPGMPPTVVTPGMKALNNEGQWVEVNVVKSRRNLPKDEAGREYSLIEGRQSGRIEKPSWYFLRLPLGRSILAGALTLMLVILPIVIISTQEALRSVPGSLREAGLGLGATKWQVVRNVTLPAAIPGIMTGSILAMSRAIGEAAPILILAGAVFIASNPSNLMDNFTVMPLQIYDWAGRPQSGFHRLAAAGIILLLGILFVFNSAAVLIRQFTRNQSS
jgi:phosphate transport system permease protein